MGKRETIAVWFSCGAASAVAAYLTIQKYKDTHDILIFNTPVYEEHEDNLRFKSDVEKWLRQEIITATTKEVATNSAEDIWRKRKYMAGVNGAPCTMILKKQARYEAEVKYIIDYHVLGFTAEEKNRHERFARFERENTLPVLIDENLTKQDCFEFIKAHGIEPPAIYQVLDNANCIGCVKATGVDYWQRIRKHFPDVFASRAKLSRELNCRLVKYKGKRIFLDELPLDAKGRMSKRRPECSIFCNNPMVNNKPLPAKIKAA